MKGHVLPRRTRERIKRETVKFGRNTIIGRYAYRYNPETCGIERASCNDLATVGQFIKTANIWLAIDHIE